MLLTGCLALFSPACRRNVDEQRYPNGQLSTLSDFRKDRDGNRILHGRYLGWYEDGQQRIEGEYLDGAQHGRWRAWHPNGQLWQDCHYDRGVPAQVTIMWDRNGAKTWEIDYRKRREDPTYIAWHPNGGRKWVGVGKFIKGQWVGKGTWYDEQGNEIAAPLDSSGNPMPYPRSRWQERRGIPTQPPSEPAAEAAAEPGPSPPERGDPETMPEKQDGP